MDSLKDEKNGSSSQPAMENVEEGKESQTPAGKRKTKHTAAASSVKRQTRQTRRQSAEDAEPVNKEEGATDMKVDLFAGPSSPAEVIAEEFDSYLDSLVSSIAEPLSDATVSHTISVNSFFQDNEFTEPQVLEEKAKVTSLKNEYNELKGKVGQLQIEIDTNTLSVQDINDQIAQLQGRRTELLQTIEMKKMEKFKHTINQKKLAEEIQKVAHEIQVKTQSQNGV